MTTKLFPTFAELLADGLSRETLEIAKNIVIFPTVRTTPQICAYVRVSTTTQKEQEHGSLDLQKATIAKYCKKNLPNIPVVYYEDGALSGSSTEKRPAYLLMMKEVMKGDYIIATKVDRLSREQKELHTLAKKCKDEGIQLIATEQAINTTTKEGMLAFSMLALVAEMELVAITERNRERRANHKEDGVYCGGAIQYGLMIDPETANLKHKKLIPNPEEQKIIADIAVMIHHKPDIAISSIVNNLIDRNITFRGKTPYYGLVRNIIGNYDLRQSAENFNKVQQHINFRL